MKSETGVDAVAANCDVTDAREVALLATHPWVIEGIDALVINHGRYDRIDAKNLDIDHLRRTMTTNFEGAFLTWNAVKSNLTDNARICVIGSQLGTRGSPHGAITQHRKPHFRPGLLPCTITSTRRKASECSSTGFVDTDILAGDSPEKRASREQEVPLKRVGTPEDIAGVVSFLVGDKSSYITGAVIHVNGGLYLP